MLLRIGPGRMDDLLMPSMESVKGSQCRCRGRQHRLIQFIQCCYDLHGTPSLRNVDDFMGTQPSLFSTGKANDLMTVALDDIKLSFFNAANRRGDPWAMRRAWMSLTSRCGK